MESRLRAIESLVVDMPNIADDGRLSEAYLDSQYAPKADVTRLFIPASAYNFNASSPALTDVATNWTAWLFDSSSIETITTSLVLPDSWTTYDVSIYWTNAGAGSGSVVWYHGGTSAIDGGNLTSGHAETGTTIAAPAQNILKISTVQAGVTASAGVNNSRLFRFASDGNDTLGNDAAVLGVLFVKAS